ncbi:MAG TPA: penicillin-binding transpeptidase domain-containing protein [Streptosporangiaceae bacterium]|nr:penicillin-binding transpeptidase domain-containing protein [Streptosporangiaceae bacterium]
MRERDSRTSGLAVTVAVFGTIASLVVAGVIAAFLIMHVTGSPEETATTFLTDWPTQLYAGMDAVTLNAPEGGVAGPLRATGAQLGMRHINLVLGQVTQNGGTAQARYTASVTIATGQVWKYQGRLQLVTQSRAWWVSWSPSDIFPGLQAGQRFVLAAAWGPRAPVLAADGTVLSSPQAIAKSPSLQLVTGNVVRATAAEAKKLGVPYQAGDPIGQGGVEEAYQQQLAGRPAVTIRIEGPGSKVDATVTRLPGGPGTPVKTSIVMHDQLAASAAVRAATTTRPVDVVALQPSTGRVLAVIERPGGFDRALQGVFPPGSTFKVVTASALSGTGLRPASTVQCPAQVNIGGRVFHNFDNEHLGAISLQTAFAVSCNSTFITLATQRLSGSTLASTAATFGFNSQPNLGIPATLGRFTTPHTQVDLAADAFGQGTDLVNPLSEASMAGAVEDGTWRPPQLVLSPAPKQTAQPQQLNSTMLATLRPMMRAVVTTGTAANIGFQAGVFGKTGTAEFGSGQNPRSHAWFVGYRGDLAFAVLVEGGGVGADASAPIANAFLRNL